MTEQKNAPDRNDTQDQAMNDADEQTIDTAAPVGEQSHDASMDPRARIAALETEVETARNDYMRALAEVENVRRRSAREREDAANYAITKFARDLLPVADNLERALAAVDGEARDREPVLDALTNGVAMTHRELLSVLERHGVKSIPAAGEPFDPHVHEAMFEVPDSSVPHGTIVEVMETGYMLHDRTLRPARVGISKGGPKRESGHNNEGEASAPEAGNDAAAYTRRTTGDQQTTGGQVDEKL